LGVQGAIAHWWGWRNRLKLAPPRALRIARLCPFRYNRLLKRPVLPNPEPKPLIWIASARDDISDLPKDVQRQFGFALRVAQLGGKHADAKPLMGFGGAGVLEMVANHDGETFRAIYTVRLAGRVYVLDVFQKKSKTGIATPKPTIDRIKARLKVAEQEHLRWLDENARDRTDDK
jgi:phage-related protein